MKEVVCLVFRQGDQFLLEQRLDDDLYHGAWTLPGGKVEAGDLNQGLNYLLIASIRESREEVGLVPEVIEPFTEFEETTRHGNRYIFHGIWVQSYRGTVREDLEPGRRILEWTSKEEVASRVADTPTNSRVWEEYLKFRRLHF